MTALRDIRRETFCHVYVENKGNGVQAAIAAGYSIPGAGVAATRLLKQPEVQKRIEELRAEAKADRQIIQRVNREWVVARMVEEAERATKSSDRIRALQLVGIELGAFTERRMEIQSPVEGLSADQLLAIVELAEQLQGSTAQPVAKSLPNAIAPRPMIEGDVTEDADHDVDQDAELPGPVAEPNNDIDS